MNFLIKYFLGILLGIYFNNMENKIFKQLSEKGYKHFTENTVEELDNLPLDSPDIITEFAHLCEWLRVNHGINVLPIESYTYPDEIKNRWKYQIINKQEKDRDIFNKKFFIESDYEFQLPQEAYSAAFDYIKENNLI